MLGTRTLLVNPPLIGGIAFTRQGRCQEREEVLGTTKPPYTLALVAAMLREPRLRRAAGRPHRHAASPSTTSIARLDDEHFAPTLIVFPSTTPTLDADVVEMAQAQGEVRRAAVLVRPATSSCTPDASMERAPDRGRHVRRRAGRRPDRARGAVHRWTTSDTIPSLTFRRDGQIVAAQGAGLVHRLPDARRIRRGICSICRSTGCRSSISRTSSSRPRAAARTPATSAWRPSIRATSSARRARRNSWTKWSAAIASSA